MKRREVFGGTDKRVIDIIVQTKIDCIDHTGYRFECVIQIGKPQQAPTGEWACPVAMLGLEKGLPSVRGEDSLQSVCLALTLVRQLLTHFVENGGRILCAGTDDEYSLDATFSGIDGGPT